MMCAIIPCAQTRRFHTVFPEDIAELLDAYAEDQSVSLSAAVRMCILKTTAAAGITRESLLAKKAAKKDKAKGG